MQSIGYEMLTGVNTPMQLGGSTNLHCYCLHWHICCSTIKPDVIKFQADG